MKSAENMVEKINKVEFKKPKYKIVNNVNASAVDDPQQIKDLLVKQIFSSVKWKNQF